MRTTEDTGVTILSRWQEIATMELHMIIDLKVACDLYERALELKCHCTPEIGHLCDRCGLIAQARKIEKPHPDI